MDESTSPPPPPPPELTEKLEGQLKKQVRVDPVPKAIIIPKDDPMLDLPPSVAIPFYRFASGGFLSKIFGSSMGSWAPYDSSSAPQLPTLQANETFTIASWNVWFEQLGQRERWAELFSILQQSRPGVMCFQEATPNFVRQILEEKWVQQEYVISDISGRTVAPYGTLLLSRYHVTEMREKAFPSRMFRNLRYAKVARAHLSPLICATVHLESLASERTRRMQLMVCHEELPSVSDAILCGDFNFSHHRNYLINTVPLENDVLKETMPDYEDVWSTLHPDDLGFTFDSSVNKMIRQTEMMRYDRMMLRRGLYRPHAMAILGNNPLAAHPDLFPSDHFGLLASFSSIV